MQTEPTIVTAKAFIALLEEMMDLKVQRYAEVHLKSSAELTHLLNEKREADRRRLDQIRAQLVQTLTGQ